MEMKPVRIDQALELNAAAHGARAAIVTLSAEPVSYSHLALQVRRLAGAFKANNCQQGEIVAILLPKTTEMVVSFIASIRAGLVVVSLDRRATDTTLENEIRTYKPNWVVTESCNLERIQSIHEVVRYEPFRVILVDGSGSAGESVHDWRKLLELSATDSVSAISLDDVAYLNPTSGTTGVPKAALATHENIYWNTVGAVTRFRLSPRDIHLCAFPSHVHPHETIARPVYLGGTMVLVEPDLDEIFRALVHFDVTCLMANPYLCSLLGRYGLHRGNFPRLKLTECGGAPASFELFQIFGELGLRVTPVWGSAETTGIALAAEDMAEPGVLGTPISGYEIRVRSEIGVVRNGEGELMVRGGGVVSGYLGGRPTEQARFADGWYHTNDRVRVVDGSVIFAGRMDNVMNVGGNKVYPDDVERVLRQHPFIREVAVVGVPSSSGVERIRAVIAVAGQSRLTEREVLEYCRGRLEPYKTPKELLIVSGLPRTSAGKIDYAELRTLHKPMIP